MLIRLAKMTAGARGVLVAKALIGLAITATYVAQTFLLAEAVRYAFTSLTWENIIPVLIGCLVLMGIRTCLIAAQEAFGKFAAGAVKEAIRVNLFTHFFRLGPGYMEEGRTGKVQAIFIDGVEAIETFLVDYLPQVMVTLVGVGCMVGYMIYLDPLVGIIVLVMALVCVTCPLFWDKLMDRVSKSHWDSYGDLNSQFVDAMQGMATLKAFRASGRMGDRLANDAQRLYAHTMDNLKISLLSSACVGFASTVGTALSVGIAALHMSMGLIGMGGVAVILFLTTECFRPINDLNAYWHRSFLGFAAAQRMFAFLDTAMPVKEIDAAHCLDDELKEGLMPVSFEDVGFAYGRDDHDTLDRFNLTVPAGKRVALVGASGAGKSTVVSLLLRFFAYDRGSVRIGGVEVDRLSLAKLRSMVSVVFQDTYLFYGTVADNVRIARPEASDADIERCCRLANIHSFIESLPDGYETVVGERGTRLSGGERQRIAIARALLKDAPILVLDEATSSVDASNEQIIQESLAALMEDRTTLVIAHRLSTVVDMDEICVLEAGHIVESGAPAELMGKENGAFAALVRAQRAGEEGAHHA